MKSPIATPEKRVKETEANVQEEIWKFIGATLKQGLKRLLESLLEDEVTTKVNARRYERSSRRQGYRGGHYIRDLVTRYGLLEALRVPRLAEGTTDFELFDKYVVDGAVNGAAALVRFAGGAGRKLQTGQLQAYGYAILLGLLVIIGIFYVVA